MAGIYKQSRQLGTVVPFRFSSRWRNESVIQRSGEILIPGDQTTTSYRSHGSEHELVQPIPDGLLDLGFDTGDTGHPFDSVKRTIKTKSDLVSSGSTSGPIQSWSSGFGPAIVTRYNNTELHRNFPVVQPMTENQTKVWGSQLIQQATPTTPRVSLATFMGETLKDGIPDFGQGFVRTRVHELSTQRNPKPLKVSDAAGQFVNYHFAMKPFLSDIIGALYTIKGAPALLAQLQRDSGKLIRRRRSLTIPDETSSSSFRGYDMGPGFYARTTSNTEGNLNLLHLGAYPSDLGGVLDEHERRTSNVWFSGSFQYLLNPGDGAMEKLESAAQQANYLLGLKVTPEVLWNLVPWSWFVDWFANVGTVISNVSAMSENGLVLKYGYLMRHTVATRYVSYTAPHTAINPGRVYTTRYRTERKERVRASPYGFGLTGKDLSFRQIGILAALAEMRAEGAMRK